MASSLLTFLLPTALLMIACVSAPAAAVATPPAPAAFLNLTGILDKAGQYKKLIDLLNSTQQTMANLNNQLNNSDVKMTILAPNDNAFSNLPSDYWHNLNNQQQVALLLYHVIPKYITESTLSFVTNPVSTESTGQLGGNFYLNFTGSNSQHNVTSGLTTTRIGTPLYDKSPLAVYPIDAVLMPMDFNKTAAPAPSPSPGPSPKSKGSALGTNDTVPSAPGSGGAAEKKMISWFSTCVAVVCIAAVF